MTIRSFVAGVTSTLALSGCAGASAAGAQSPDPAGAPLDHAYMYHVSEAQVASADTGSVTVSGSAEVSVTPDRALVTFAVVTEGPSADEAARRNAELMNAVLAAVRRDAARGLRLETFGYGLSPIYTQVTEAGQRRQRISGYRASNNVRATTDDVEAVGGIIDAAIGAGANQVANLAFQASDTREARLNALRQAVEKAREEAAVMAEALGRTLGPALEVTGGASMPPTPVRYRMEMVQAADASTPIEAGDQTVSAQVTIRFALGPARGR